MEDLTEHINKKLKPNPESDEDVDIKPMIPELNNIDMLTLPRICARCRIDFVDERNLRSHFLKFRNQASFSCELCHKSYVRADILQEHQRVHMNENLYKCVRCFYSCNQIYDIYEHMHSVHKLNIDTVFKCPYDDIVFRDSTTLFQHIGCHRVNVKQEKDSMRDNSSASEIKASGNNKNNKVSGEENEERPEDETDADDGDGGILPSTLLECNLDTRNLLEVVRKQAKSSSRGEDRQDNAENEPPPPPHGLDKTSDLVDEVLDEIDKSTLIDVDYVKNDMVINTENFSNLNSDDSSIRMLCYFKNIKCAYCTKVFIMKNDLKNHLVEDHDHSKLVVQDVEIANAEQFECTVCNIKFDFAIDLTHHTNKEHTKYECEFCNKVYNQSYTLKKHMKTCSPEIAAEIKAGRGPGHGTKASGPPICELCDKLFKRNWNLKQHMQKIHKVTKT